MEEETRDSGRDGEDRSDAQVPRYTFSFHLPGVLSETEKSRKKEKEKKKRAARAHALRKKSRKILAVLPRARLDRPGLLYPVRTSESREFRFATSLAREKKKKEQREGYVAGTA